METKVCSCCGKEKPVSEFYRNAWGVTSVCSECHAKKSSDGRRKAKEAKSLETRLQEARLLRLQDFTPRELMCELKRRGYEGQFTYTEVHVIKLEDL